MVDRSKRILITGITGFTGRHLCAALHARGYEFLGLSKSDSRFTVVDLGDLQQVVSVLSRYEPTHIVHLGGISFPGHNSPSEIYTANLCQTVTLLEAVQASSIDVVQIILASSAAVYGASPDDLPITEEAPLLPSSHYSLSKCFAEQSASLFSNLPILTVRPFNYVGPGQGDIFFVPKIVSAFLAKERKLKIGNLNIIRDFSDVRDVSEAYARLIDLEITGQTLNICSGHGTHLSDIVRIVSELTGHVVELIPDSALMRKSEPNAIIGSNEKLVSMIGPYIKHRLADTLSWIISESERAQL